MEEVKVTKQILPTTRGVIKYILLSLITFGIYPLYLLHAMAKETNITCAEDGKKTKGLLLFILFSAITFGIYAIVWWYNLANRLDKNLYANGKPSAIDGVGYLLWNIFGSLLFGLGPIIALHKLFKNLNNVNTIYNLK